MAPPNVKASGTATATTTPAPAADAPKKDEAASPDSETWQLHPYGGIDFNLYDAGLGTDGVFSSGFGTPSDQTWLQLNAGFTTNVNANDVRFEFGPELAFGMLRGGPQTNESKVNNLSIGPKVVLDWNRAYGFSHLRLFGRLDAEYGIGYAWGETTANPSIRKYEQEALSHKLRGALEVVGWNFDGGEAALNINGGTYIADGKMINNTGILFGLGAELRLGSHGAVKAAPVPVCFDTVQDIKDNRVKLLAAMKKAEEMEISVNAYRGYLETLPKNPFNQANIRKALVLGNVALQMDAKTELETGKIQEAARAANRMEDMEKATAALIAKTGLTEEEVKAMVADAEKRFPADYNDFWKLPDGSPLTADADAMTKPVKADPCDPETAEVNRALWDALDKANDRIAALEQQIKRAIHLAGLFLGDDIVAKVPKPFTLRFDTPNYDSARPNDKDIAALKAWAETHKASPAAKDDAGLMKILDRRETNRGRATKVFALNQFEVEKLYNLSQFLLGNEKLQGQVKLEEQLAKKGIIKAKEEGATKEIGPDSDLELGKTIKVTFVGHTDAMGDDKMNQELSQRRSDAIKYILIGFGVPEERINAVGMGEEFPSVPEPKGGNSDHVSRIKNRRVELYLEGEDPADKVAPKRGSKGSDSEDFDITQSTPEDGVVKPAAKRRAAAAAAPTAAPAAPQPQPKPEEKKKPKNPFDIEQGDE